MGQNLDATCCNIHENSTGMDVKCICQRFGFEPAPGREIEAKRIPPFAKKDPWDKYQRFLSSFDGVIIHFGNAVLSRIINSQIIMTVHSTFNLNNRATTTFHTPKCRIRITWRILKPRSSFLSVLVQHTSYSLTCIRITWGIIETKTLDSFLQGFSVIEG